MPATENHFAFLQKFTETVKQEHGKEVGVLLLGYGHFPWVDIAPPFTIL